MRILMVNKFLYPKGGSETYIFKLGNYLATHGHEVQYFGMEHDERIVGNSVDAYTSNIDFHDVMTIKKLLYPITTIYSIEARSKIRKVLDSFNPDVVHLNNFNYQLTPSVILEIISHRNKTKKPCRIVYTAHDAQLVCPNHLLKNPNDNQICEKCIDGSFINCTKGKCIHGSISKSLIGTTEAYYWKLRGIYKNIDTIICCSQFFKDKLDHNPVFSMKTVVLHNFVDQVEWKTIPKKDYVLYFGRLSEEKGIATLAKVCEEMPEVRFVFAGAGSMEYKLKGLKNVTIVGFKTGEELEQLIREARFSVYPSEWYENCPFSVMESQMYGTPVLGANIGGIPELIKEGETGELFESGNKNELKEKVYNLWKDKKKVERYSDNCRYSNFDSIDQYCEKLIKMCYLGQ